MSTRTTISPVVPSPASGTRLQPLGLGASRIDGGLWHDLRRRNREVTIPHGAAQLEAVGNLANFRLAAMGAEDGYAGGVDDAGRPFPFLDSEVYKWLEAVGWELAAGPDAELARLADPVIDLVGRAQRPDGYLNTYFQVAERGRVFTDLHWGHELYTAGHLVQAAVAWRRSTGDERLLRIAERAVGRIEAEVGPGRRDGIDGHPEIEMALVELYRLTGAERHLRLAQTLVERRGRGLLGPGRYGARYWQDHETVRAARDPAGHAVRQVYLDCGVVDVAIETGDADLLDAALARWGSMQAAFTYLTGALGSRHRDEAFGEPFELPPDRAYAETCAAIGSSMLAWRLLLATGETRFADAIERTASNAVLSGLALDGCRFYYSSPLQRRTGSAMVREGAATTGRVPWYPCSCCPPNLMRFIATFPDLIATRAAGGLQLHQYATGQVEGSVAGGAARVSIATGYPWSGEIGITIEATPAGRWPLTLRIPGWCHDARVTVNGEDVRDDGASRGTRTLDRRWEAGDLVRLTLAMPPRVTVADPRIDAVRGTIALERGPIVYALEEPDLPAGVVLEAIEVSADPELGVVPGGAALPDGSVALTLDARVRREPERAAWPYGATASFLPASPGEPVRVQAVPYFATANRGGTAMRVWLPVASAASQADDPGPEGPREAPGDRGSS